MNKRDWVKNNKPLLMAILIYVLICILFIGSYRHLINPDGVSYISIAREYASANFSNAINGYWSPVISWLLSPFIYMNKDALVAARLIFIISGIMTLILSNLIINHWKIKKTLRVYYFIAVTPLLAYWSMAGPITPDMLVVPIILAYAYLLFQKPNLRRAVIIGTLAGLGYLTKSYLLPFFIISGLIIFLYERRIVSPKQNNNLAKFWFVSLAVCTVLCAPWIGLLTAKYNHITYSTSGSYNFAIQNPAKPGHPLNTIGLTKPPHENSLTAWEDPTYIKRFTWSPIGSKSEAAGMIRIFFDNAKRIGASFLELSVFSLAMALVVITYILNRKKDTEVNKLVILMGIYLSGYLFLLAETRYFWSIFICIVLCSIRIAQQYFGKLNAKAANLVLVIITLSIAVTPLTQIYYQRKSGEPAYYQAQEYSSFLKPGDRIASNDFNSVRICYFNKVKCYGVISSSSSDDQIKNELGTNSIEYVVLYDREGDLLTPSYLENFREIKRVGLTRLLQREY